MLPVDKEAVITVVRVVFVDETCEKSGAGVNLSGGSHCGEAMLRRWETMGDGCEMAEEMRIGGDAVDRWYVSTLRLRQQKHMNGHLVWHER